MIVEGIGEPERPAACESGRVKQRRRDSEATKLAIIQAARLAFSARSYDQVGIRDITAAASVSSSLVSRYFGSKQNLFAETMRLSGLSLLLDIGTSRFVPRLVNHHDCGTGRIEFDPIIALIRSAFVEKTQPVLENYLESNVIAPISALIEGHGREERARLLVSLIVGLTLMKKIARGKPKPLLDWKLFTSLIENMMAEMLGEKAPA